MNTVQVEMVNDNNEIKTYYHILDEHNICTVNNDPINCYITDHNN